MFQMKISNLHSANPKEQKTKIKISNRNQTMRQTRAVQTLSTENQQHNITLSDKQKAKNTRGGTQACSKLTVVLHYSYKTRPVLFLKLKKKTPDLEISFWDLTYYIKKDFKAL